MNGDVDYDGCKKIEHMESRKEKESDNYKVCQKIWDREIEEIHFASFAFTKLKACEINKIGDLYATNPKNEPGWYAVRELFEKIPSCR